MPSANENEHTEFPTPPAILYLARKNRWDAVLHALSTLERHITSRSRSPSLSKSSYSDHPSDVVDGTDLAPDVCASPERHMIQCLSTEHDMLSGDTIGHFAACANRVDVLQLLFRLEVDLRKSNFSNRSPMQEARHRENEAALEFILENVYSPVELLFYGDDSYEHMVQVFTRHPEAIDDPLECYNNMSWVCLCVEEARLEDLKWLRDHGANFKVTDECGNTLLHMSPIPYAAEPEEEDEDASSEGSGLSHHHHHYEIQHRPSSSSSLSDGGKRPRRRRSSAAADSATPSIPAAASEDDRQIKPQGRVGRIKTEDDDGEENFSLTLDHGYKAPNPRSDHPSISDGEDPDSPCIVLQRVDGQPREPMDRQKSLEPEDEVLEGFGPLSDFSVKEIQALRVLSYLLSLDEIDVNQTNLAGLTPSHVIAERGGVNPTVAWRALRLLKHCGADFNIQDGDGLNVSMALASSSGDGPWLAWCLMESESGGGGCDENMTDTKGRRVEDHIVTANLETFDAELDIDEESEEEGYGEGEDW